MGTTTGTRPNRKKSQKTYVLEALLKGAKLTPLTAMNSWGIMRLAAIISELRHKEGYNIATTMVKGRTGSKFAQYSITQ
tara:strand:+ start:54 stop:290 length:237 start_codon:yes stop_codon:yes gene_type:complete